MKRTIIAMLALVASSTAIAQIPTMPTSGIHSVKGTFPGSKEIVTLKGEIKNGFVITEGDIILGPVAKFFGLKAYGAGGNQSSDYFKFWANSTIPYVLPEITAKKDIEKAISFINQLTNLYLVPRTTETDYISFESGYVCESYVGKQGGEQKITISQYCGYGAAIHEILHAAGLWHEQSRTDRDDFVNIYLDNVPAGKQHNFEKYLDRKKYGFDIGAYDYNSIMHYQKYEFAVDKTKPTIQAKDSTIQIGQRTSLSLGDIAAINALYPVKPKPVTGTELITANVNGSINFTFKWSKSIASNPSPGAITVKIKAPKSQKVEAKGNVNYFNYQPLSSMPDFTYSYSGSQITATASITGLPANIPIELEILVNSTAFATLPTRPVICSDNKMVNCTYNMYADNIIASNMKTQGTRYILGTTTGQVTANINGGWHSGARSLKEIEKVDFEKSKKTITDKVINPGDNIIKVDKQEKIVTGEKKIDGTIKTPSVKKVQPGKKLKRQL